MSLDLDSVLDVLRSHDLPSPTLQAIAKDLIAAERQTKEEAAAESAANPKVKTKMVVFVRGNAALRDLVAGGAWVLRVREDDQTTTIQSRVKAVAKLYNERLTRHRSSRVIRTWARALEWAKGKVVKDAQGAYTVLTRQPVEVQVVEREEVMP